MALINKTKGFHFTTEKGNIYFYNDINGSILPCNDINNAILDSSSNNNESVCFVPINIDSKDSSIIHYLKSVGYQQLTLIVTEQCNLRCKYCAYSGNYNNFRTHSKNYMPRQIAEKAVRKYFEGFYLKKAMNPYSIPQIGFYGGEPLLDFNLIKSIVYYTKKLYNRPINFNLTTNGILLTDEIIDFFKGNGFALSVSLNGPKSENDRLRVFPNGAGSFDLVWNNLQRIRERYPKYYESKCSIIIIYDIGTDLLELTHFFDRNDKILPPLGRCSGVSRAFTDWYSNYSSEQITLFQQQFENLRQLYVHQLLNNKSPSKFLEMLIGTRYKNLMMRPQDVVHRYDFIPFTAACLPGQRIGVDPSGNFHACEKINYNFPIGNVDSGIEIGMIKKVLKTYQEQIFPDCTKCNITRLCPVCYAVVGGSKGFEKSPKDICKHAFDDIKDRFQELWTLFEEGVAETAILKVRSNSCTDT